MSILEKYSSAFMSKDEAAMNEVLHEDYQFTICMLLVMFYQSKML